MCKRSGESDAYHVLDCLYDMEWEISQQYIHNPHRENTSKKEAYNKPWNLPTAPPRESKPANIVFFREIPKVDDDGGSDAVVTAMQHAAIAVAAAEVIVMPFIVFLSSYIRYSQLLCNRGERGLWYDAVMVDGCGVVEKWEA